MTTLLMVRHAPTPETGRRLTGRLPGVSLGPEGIRAAERVAAWLSDRPIRAVYASPLERTWETAEILAASHGLEPAREDGLLEVDYGRWSGRTLKSLARLKAWSVVQSTPSRVAFPEGERLADAQARAVAAVERLADGHRRQMIALVTHADIIKAVVSHHVGQPLDLFQRIAVAPASVTTIDLPAVGPPTIVSLNTAAPAA